VICANHAPDHVTINRFRAVHAEALAGLFGQVLTLCARARMVRVGTIALDGTRMAANAAREANMDFERLAREIIAEAGAVDAAEDEEFGERRGDELPPELVTGEGRQAWLREAKRQLDAERAARAEKVPRDRPARLAQARRRLIEDWRAELRAHESYAAWRARGIAADGSRRMAPGTTKTWSIPQVPTGLINTTDPDSRLVKGEKGFLQGYTAQAVATADQIIVAADVICGANERYTLEPLVNDMRRELDGAGIDEQVEVVVADAGFWNTRQIERIAQRGIRPLVNPDGGKRSQPSTMRKRPHYERMREELSTEEGWELYRQRKRIIEPIFGQTKFNRRIDRFQRRGLPACRAEWRLIAATHNLLKLWRHGIAIAPA